MKFEYDEIWIRERYDQKEYYFGKMESCTLLGLLNDIGYAGWELVGEVDGKIIVKRLIDEG